jgi:hypothetical protein
MSALKYPLNNVQIELMKLFSTNLSDKELTELKELLSGFYSKRAIKEADDIWDKKGFTNEDVDKWLNEKS